MRCVLLGGLQKQHAGITQHRGLSVSMCNNHSPLSNFCFARLAFLINNGWSSECYFFTQMCHSQITFSDSGNKPCRYFCFYYTHIWDFCKFWIVVCSVHSIVNMHVKNSAGDLWRSLSENMFQEHPQTSQCDHLSMKLLSTENSYLKKCWQAGLCIFQRSEDTFNGRGVTDEFLTKKATVTVWLNTCYIQLFYLSQLLAYQRQIKAGVSQPQNA